VDSFQNRVLVIDDSALARNILRGALEEAGFRVETAENGPEGIERVGSFGPDVVVCDMLMPVMNGIEVLERVRSMAPTIPVLIFTESSEVNSAVSAMRNGAFAYMLKGISDGDLVNEINAALESQRLRERNRHLEAENLAYQQNLEAMVQEKAGEIIRLQELKALEHRKAEAAEGSFRVLLQRSPEPIVIQQEGVIVEANPAFLTLLGYVHAKEPIGTPAEAIVHPMERATFLARLRGSGSPQLEFHAIHQSGRSIDIGVFPIVVLYEGAPATLLLMRDITEKKQLTAQVMQMDRLAAVGTLAAGVAHEINTPLAYVNSNICFVESELACRSPGQALTHGELEELARVFKETRQGLQRVNQIVCDLKGMSRQDDVRCAVDLRELLESTARMAGPTAITRARLVVDLTELPTVTGNAGRLGQVFLNLLINAAQAITEGKPRENEVRLTARARGERVIVEVRDTGSGMSAEVRDRLFEPFFTTKPQGVGTGLGLSICHAIITAHGGAITVETGPGSGTTFRVELPIVGPAEAEVAR
jgi:PAS domain S-box-containing protein